MPTPQRTKKHHFVPEVYLRNFVTDGSFHVLDIRKVQKGFNEFPKESQPGKICYIEDFYTITDELRAGQSFNLQDLKDLYIESEALTAQENRYSAIYTKLVVGNELSMQDGIDLVNFIILLKTRNPYWFEKVIVRNKELWIDESMENIKNKMFSEDFPFKHIPDELRQMVLEYVRDDNKSDPTLAKKMQLFGLVQRHLDTTNRNDQFRKALLDSEWMIMKAPQNGPFFCTIDNPGFSIAKDGLTYNTRFVNGFFFVFPLSPTHCLFIGDEGKDDAYTNGASKKIVTTGPVDSDTVIRMNNSGLAVMNRLLIGDKDYLSKIAQVNAIKKN